MPTLTSPSLFRTVSKVQEVPEVVPEEGGQCPRLFLIRPSAQESGDHAAEAWVISLVSDVLQAHR